MDKNWDVFQMAQFLEFPLEIPALAVPLVTVRGVLENKGWPVESCLDAEGCGGKAAVAAASRAGCPESKRCSHFSALHEKRARPRRVAGGRD